MAQAIPGVANPFAATMVEADGTPIVAGMVNFYLVAMSGANAGKWFRGSDQTWQAAESIAAVGSHAGNGHWTASIHLAAWTDGLVYRLYAAEDGGLSVAYGYDVYCSLEAAKEATVNALPAAIFANDLFVALLSAAGYYLREVEVLTRDSTTGEVLTATYTLHKANGDVLATLNYVATVDGQHRLATHEMEAE